MFGIEFYPTPQHVIEAMLKPYKKMLRKRSFHGYTYEGYDLENKIILEPSAGKADILDYLTGNYVLGVDEHDRTETTEESINKNDVYCCELDSNLKHILQEKGYKVIAEDFLQYSGDHLFDLIIMNPPFSNGDEHLLKAWEILEDGEIICLLNSETLNNPYTERRKLLKTILDDNNAIIENLGNCFSTADRTTNVNVSLVRLTKKSNKKKLEFTFQNVTKETKHTLDEELFKNPVATRDVIGNLMIQYDELKKNYVEYLKIREALQFFSAGLTGDHKNIIEIAEKSLCNTNNKSYNNFCDNMKQEIWSIVLRKTKVEKYMTHQVRQNFQNFAKHQGYLDFTKENVASLITMIFENRHTIMEQAIIDVFDIFTTYHKENRCYVEGWKTNDHWKVNKKIILPRWVKYGDYMNQHDLKKYGDKFKTNYSYSSEYSDIDKVMCYITGSNFDHCYTIYEALDRKFDILGNVGSGSFDGTCESQFFNMRFYKKGTLHLEFKDEKLWQEFNLRACSGKKWLPDHEEQDYQRSKEKSNKQSETNQSQILQLEQYRQGQLFAS